MLKRISAGLWEGFTEHEKLMARAYVDFLQRNGWVEDTEKWCFYCGPADSMDGYICHSSTCPNRNSP